MKENTYITYAKLLSLLHYYFLMNGGEDFMDGGEMAIMINLAIQDIINNSSFSFMAKFQNLQPETYLYEGTYKIFKTKYPINRIHEVLKDGEGANIVKHAVNTMPYLNTDTFYYKRGTNIVYMNKHVKSITINYERDYVVNDLNTDDDRQKELPIPFTFVPALIKMIYDWASPFTFFQGDGSSSDYYGHSKTRINDLVDTDALVSQQNISIGEME